MEKNRKSTQRPQPPTQAATPSVNWRQATAGAVIGAMLGIGATQSINQYLDVRRTRATAQRVATAVLAELGVNLAMLQIKGGTAWGMATGQTTSDAERRLSLAALRATKFSAFTPKVFGADFKSLESLGERGIAAYDKTLRFYRTLETVDKEEAQMLSQVEAETDPAVRQRYFASLDQQYDALRALLEQAAQALTSLEGPGTPHR